MSRGGWDEVIRFGTAGVPLTSGSVAAGAMVVAVVLGRFASGELGREGGAWSEILSIGGGVAALVITSPRPISSTVTVGERWLTENALSGCDLGRVEHLDCLHLAWPLRVSITEVPRLAGNCFWRAGGPETPRK
jgi:hypothetical protein